MSSSNPEARSPEKRPLTVSSFPNMTKLSTRASGAAPPTCCRETCIGKHFNLERISSVNINQLMSRCSCCCKCFLHAGTSVVSSSNSLHNLWVNSSRCISSLGEQSVLLAKLLCAQCSSTITSPSRGPNSGWNSPPQVPAAKLRISFEWICVGFIYFHPFIVAFTPAVMRYDEDLNMRCSHSGDQLAHIVIKADCLSCLFSTLIQLASFTHKIIVRICY